MQSVKKHFLLKMSLNLHSTFFTDIDKKQELTYRGRRRRSFEVEPGSRAGLPVNKKQTKYQHKYSKTSL